MKNWSISSKNVNEFAEWGNFANNEWLSVSNKDTATVIEDEEGKTAILYSMGYSVHTELFADMVFVDESGKFEREELMTKLSDILIEDDWWLAYEMLEELALTPQGFCHDDENLLYELFGGLSTPTTQHASSYEIASRKEYMNTPTATETDLDHLFGRDGMFQPAR